METNNSGKPDATRAGAPTSNCNNKTWDSQQSTEYNSDSEKSTTKEHRAAWPLPPLAANQSPAPISEHVPQAKLAPYIEQERRGGMDGIWLSHMMVVRISHTQSLPTSLSQKAFSTPPHLFSAIHSVLYSPFGKETRIIVFFFCGRMISANTKGAAVASSAQPHQPSEVQALGEILACWLLRCQRRFKKIMKQTTSVWAQVVDWLRAGHQVGSWDMLAISRQQNFPSLVWQDDARPQQ